MKYVGRVGLAAVGIAALIAAFVRRDPDLLLPAGVAAMALLRSLAMRGLISGSLSLPLFLAAAATTLVVGLAVSGFHTAAVAATAVAAVALILFAVFQIGRSRSGSARVSREG